jgi:hypothetical protein
MPAGCLFRPDYIFDERIAAGAAAAKRGGVRVEFGDIPPGRYDLLVADPPSDARPDSMTPRVFRRLSDVKAVATRGVENPWRSIKPIEVAPVAEAGVLRCRFRWTGPLVQRPIGWVLYARDAESHWTQYLPRVPARSLAFHIGRMPARRKTDDLARTQELKFAGLPAGRYRLGWQVSVWGAGSNNETFCRGGEEGEAVDMPPGANLDAGLIEAGPTGAQAERMEELLREAATSRASRSPDRDYQDLED